jgi:hypothetical protein
MDVLWSAGGGLSSSSALVVASAVTALTLWHVPADRMQIAALAARWVLECAEWLCRACMWLLLLAGCCSRCRHWTCFAPHCCCWTWLQ